MRRCRVRSARSRAAAAVLPVVGLAALADRWAAAAGDSGGCDAVTAVWIGPESGSMLDPDNWSTGLVPDPDTTIVFESPNGDEAELLDGDLPVRRIVVRGSLTQVTVFGGLLSSASGSIACPAVEIGGPGPAVLEVLAGVSAPSFPLGTFTAESARIGTDLGSGRFEGLNGFARLEVDDAVLLGGESPGTLRQFIELSCTRLVVGLASAAVAEQIGRLDVADTTIVGDGAFGELELRTFDLGDLVLGLRPTGTGVVRDLGVADGPRRLRGDVAIGDLGVGLLELTRSTHVDGDVRLGVSAALDGDPGILDRGDGTLWLAGAATTLHVGGDLLVGVLGNASLVLRDGARAVIDGSIGFLEVPPTLGPVERRVRIELGPPAPETPVLAAGGGLALPGLEIAVAEGVVPHVGQAWRLVEAGGELELPTPTLSALPPGLGWSLAVEDGGLTARVVAVPLLDGDLDDDGDVDLADLVLLLAAFGPCPDGAPCPADLDADGAVDALDLLILLDQWTSAPSGASARAPGRSERGADPDPVGPTGPGAAP